MKKQKTSTTVKNIRHTLDLTQEQFAVRIGVTVSTVNRWEKNKSKPSPLAMRRIREMQNKSTYQEGKEV